MRPCSPLLGNVIRTYAVRFLFTVNSRSQYWADSQGWYIINTTQMQSPVVNAPSFPLYVRITEPPRPVNPTCTSKRADNHCNLEMCSKCPIQQFTTFANSK